MHPTRVTGCISYICSKSCINISTGKYGPRWKVAGHSVRMIGNACVKHTHTHAHARSHMHVYREQRCFIPSQGRYLIYILILLFSVTSTVSIVGVTT